MASPGKAQIAQIIQQAPIVASATSDEASEGPAPFDEGAEADATGPSDANADGVNSDVVALCAAFDHSDTDNAMRLVHHFGADLAVLETEGAASADYFVWTGTHWNATSGNDSVKLKAQKVGGRIALEADHLAYLPFEVTLMDRASKLKAKDPDHLTEEERGTIAEAAKVPAALTGRKTARRKFGVSSKNVGRIKAMLDCAAPHLTRKPDHFNAEPHLVAVQGHTLRFFREIDAECPDPAATRLVGRLEPIPGHRRGDLITKLAPVAYDPEARCPKWDAFLAECLPNEAVRRCVQVYTGLGLTGIGLQRVMFHYGSGANGKSVFLETIMRLLGPLGVGLPSASITGDSRASGQQASPDIARLYGARIVRVLELPADEPLKEDLVKTLSGGERMPVRNLFKGFFEFTPVFKAHMSGNGYPRIDGTDNGIWRRMTVIHWGVTIPEERRRELDLVVGEFMTEAPGILNWLIEGVIDFLGNGFTVPDAVKASTKEYRDEMDPIGQFVADCVALVEGQRVRARHMYQSYCAWSESNAKKAWSETRFGRVMKGKLTRIDGKDGHHYADCVLHDVPVADPSDGARNPSA